ncbi:Dihydrofolate reductase type 3 [Stieleria bergensis]|uniref:Dihydrofolate reductase n=1 Tax=Stieleria bergensis TaxID=2528025 RepID=A0A517SZG9_9BACT|nr:Dihydrofolate reductase type 3 [Planctomycetes bacterium SV_7m_r]
MQQQANSTPRVGFTALVAMTDAGVIGKDGTMPWRLRSDLQRFKQLTMGGVLIMGRKTFDSIGRPLPGRGTIVITRQPDWSFADPAVQVAGSIEKALTLIADRQAYVVGGAQIYRQMMDHCDRVHLTRVLADVPGDTHLELDLSAFSRLSSEAVPAGPKDDHETQFETWQRGPDGGET